MRTFTQFSPQNYNKIMEYTNFWRKKINISIYFIVFGRKIVIGTLVRIVFRREPTPQGKGRAEIRHSNYKKVQKTVISCTFLAKR